MNTYQPEDIQEILQLALARHSSHPSLMESEFTKQQLLEIGAELGITEVILKEAEQDWLKSKVQRQKHQEFDLYRRSQLRYKTIRYLIICGFFMGLNLLTSGGISWSIYVVFCLGLPLSLTAWKTFQKEGAAYDRAFEEWHNKQELKRTFDGVWKKVQKFLS